MIIKSFEEFINEGFIGKTLDRYKTGGKRIEDDVSSNINSLGYVDLGLPFFFADSDLEIEDNDRFNYNEMLEHVEFIKSKGWRVPTKEDIDKLLENIKYEMRYDESKKSIVVTSDKTKEDVYFPITPFSSGKGDENYWLYESYEKHEPSKRTFLLGMRVVYDDHPTNKLRITCPYSQKQNRNKIRLIKDK